MTDPEVFPPNIDMTEFFATVERHQNDILYTGYKDGKRVVERERFNPVLYLPTHQKSKFQGLDGRMIAPKHFKTMGECNNFIKQNSGISGFALYGLHNMPEQYINWRFPDGCEEGFDRSVINVTFFDLEVESDDGFPEPDKAEKEITAICLKNNQDNLYHVWGCAQYVPHRKDIDWNYCEDEYELLESFMSFWVNNYPDIVSGWNSQYFDMPYLVNRIIKVLGKDWADHLSPWGVEPNHSTYMGDISYDIKGIQQLDYMALFKKLAYTYGNQESYKLDNIANVVLGEKKLDYSEYGNLFSLYKNNFQKFIEYNVKDVELVQKMEDKLQLITLTLTLGYKANVNAVVSMGSVKIWDTYIYNTLKRHNIIIPFVDKKESDRSIEGAFVKEPIVGMYDWVVSFDLNSLYPSIIRQYNMSPETIIQKPMAGVNVESILNNEFDVPEDNILCATGQMFDSKRKGFFPSIVEKLYNERVEIKRKTLDLKQESEKVKGKAKQDLIQQIASLDNNQMAIKIMLNSLYGAMSNKWFRYYDIRIAEGITLTGQATIKWGEKVVNHYLNSVLKTEGKDYVIAIDTDSLYVNLGDLVSMYFDSDTAHSRIVDFLDEVGKTKLEPLFKDAYTEFQRRMNCPTNIMEMAREAIASRAIWTGKKRYVMNVYDNEGVRYAEPKIKVTGLESVRSSTPQVCRTMIEETMRIILREDEITVQKFIAECRDTFKECRVEDIAFPRGVSNIDTYTSNSTIYTKATPMHVRASIMYNYLLKKHNLEKRYVKISNGDKMKFCYMIKPNPCQENVLAFLDILPPEFNYEKYVDYDTQFSKAYLDPINSILQCVGWTTEKISTLEDFFE